MTRTVESIAQFGVLAPLIARPRPDGDGYEIISGHRRQFAAKMAGLETLPVIVRDMDDDAATILMVDSNLQREHISPSERAFAYKMKLDALKNQGARSDLTSRQVVGKLEAADVIGKATDESGRQVQRYVRLTNLIPELLNMVDEKMISFNGQMYDVVAGTFLVVGEGAEDFESLSPELAQKYEKHFHQPETILKLGNRLLVIPIPDDAVKSAENKAVNKPPAEHDR